MKLVAQLIMLTLPVRIYQAKATLRK
jgi:hypothetical protein